MSNHITRLAHWLLSSLLATFLSISLAHAATITVTSTADTGVGSLRQAIADASANDTINVNVNGTITLASPLTINKNLSFVGNGVGNTIIDGNNSVRLFNVSASITASWTDMTLTRGSAATGGCILASGGSVVTLTRVTASACAATGTGSGGAIFGFTVNLIDSTLSGNSAGGNGGGISTNGALTISNSTLNGNMASLGGAICAKGNFTVTNSTIAANSASEGGGGISFRPQYSTDIGTILHSTISGNTALEGGGIHGLDINTISIGHTLLADNTATSNPDGLGYFTSTAYNVIGNTTGMDISGDTTGNIIGPTPSQLGLGPLADNGGLTKTMAIGVGSVAYNAGNPAFAETPSTDQRGTARVKDGRIDIGAYESDPFVTLSPTTLNIAEGSSANVTLTRTGSTTSALTVNLSITQGTGITGADYTLSGASISGQSGSVTATIPAGNSSVHITVAAENDVVQESSEVLTLTLVDALGYDLGATPSSAVTLLDNDFVLSVTTTGTGSGTVGGSVAGTYNAGSALTLTATPGTGSTFAGWSAGCSPSFNMPSSDLTCTATFTLNSYAIITTASPAAGGTVNCTSNPVSHGASSTCTATPNTGYTFGSWSGDCAGANCVLSNVTAARSVTATFVLATTSRSSISILASGVTATLSATGCSAVDSATFIQPPAGAPSNMSFPYGLLDFTLSGCAGSATVTVTYSQNLPGGATFYKERAGRYLPYTASIGANSVTFTLLDNDAEWDGDSGAGVIKDPSGLGFGAGGSATSIPTLSEWGMILLSGLIALFALRQVRQQQRGRRSISA